MRFVPLAASILLVAGAGCAHAPGAKAQNAVTVALLQMRPDGNNVDANLAKAELFCREAAAEGADIALMPEMWSIGYTRFDADKPGAREEFYKDALAIESPAIQHFAELARELDMAVGVAYLQAYSPLPRNAITLFDRHGREVFTYAKVHTSDFKSMEASMTPGHEFYVGELDTKAGPVKVGAMICFDREQPESARILMLKGTELILTPNACGLDELRLDQFKIRAWENVVGVAMANYPKPNQNGHSAAYDAAGRCLVKADGSEGIFTATFDLDDLRDRRSRVIWGNAYRRPHRYGILTSPEKEKTWQRTDGNGLPYDALQR